jgi:hypothetical protein
MQTFKIELIESARIELYIANTILDYIRKFEGLLQRFTVLVQVYSDIIILPTLLEELIERKERIIWNINNCKTKLNESRVRYVEIQASLSECEAVIAQTVPKFNKN